jgi:hypothetical protein
MTMPSHGWFEVWCNINRLSDVDRKYLHPVFAGKRQFELELIHIDDHFIRKYGNVRIPYMKASDHIFVVVAMVNSYPLVTRDEGMRRVAVSVGVNVYTPTEYVATLTSANR